MISPELIALLALLAPSAGILLALRVRGSCRRQLKELQAELLQVRAQAARVSQKHEQLAQYSLGMQHQLRSDEEQATRSARMAQLAFSSEREARETAEAALHREQQRLREISSSLELLGHRAAALETDYSDLSQREALLIAERIRTNELVASREQELAGVREELTSLELVMARAQMERARLITDAHQVKLKAQESERERGALASALACIQEERNLVRTQLTRETRERARAEADLRSTQWVLAQLEDTLDALATEIRLEHEAARTLDQELTRARNELHDAAPPSHASPVGAQTDAKELAGLRAENHSLTRERIRLERRVLELEARETERMELSHEVGHLRKSLGEVAELQTELSDLRAKLYSAPSRQSAIVPKQAAAGWGATSVESFLQRILECTPARSAVVADALGFPVAAVGDPLEHECLAALAGEASRAGDHARQLLGLAEITQLTLRDRLGSTVHYRFFACGSDVMAVGALGEQSPDQQLVEGAVVATLQQLGEDFSEFLTTDPGAKVRSSA